MQPVSPVHDRVTGAVAIYGNINYYENFLNSLKDLYTMDPTDNLMVLMQEEEFIRITRAKHQEKMILTLAREKTKKFLSSKPFSWVLSEAMDAADNHEGRHLIDVKTMRNSREDMEIRGHLAQMRANYVGWIMVLNKASENFFFNQKLGQAPVYIVEKAAEYIKLNPKLFPMINGQEIDEIEAQLYKIGEPKEDLAETKKSLELLQHLADVIFEEHKKEYGQKMNNSPSTPQVIQESKNSSSSSKESSPIIGKIIGGVAAAVAIGVGLRYLHQRAQENKKAETSAPQAPPQQPQGAVKKMSKKERKRQKSERLKGGEGRKPDKALITNTNHVRDPDLGGISMNSANLDLQIKRDGKGVPLPLGQQDMAQLSHIQGFDPEILEIKTATIPPFLVL